MSSASISIRSPLAGGAVHDPLAALVFCRPAERRFS
jgi:hypothetical protein